MVGEILGIAIGKSDIQKRTLTFLSLADIFIENYTE